VKVHNEKTGEVYEEGRDFAAIADHDSTSFGSRRARDPASAGSRIHAGDRLRVDYYHGTTSIATRRHRHVGTRRL